MIVFPGESFSPLKPDLESIESFDNSQVGAIEKFSTVSTGVISITDVVAKSGDTMTGTLIFDNTEAQGNAMVASLNLATTSRTLLGGVNLVLSTTTGTKIGTGTNQLLGFYNATPVDQPAAVANATGAGDVVAQLNALLSRMRELGLIAT